MATTTPDTQALAHGRFIRGSVSKVRRVLDQIRGRTYRDALIMLEFMPYRFKVLEGAERKGIRSIAIRPYLVRFRVEEQAGIVRILHVRHGARRAGM